MAKKPSTYEPADPGPQPDIPPLWEDAPADKPAPASTTPALPENYDLRINELASSPGAVRDLEGAEPLDGPEISPLAVVAADRTQTVTLENPTPPTNVVCAQGYPPSTYAWAAAPAAGSGDIFAVNTVGTYLPEGSGSEVLWNFPSGAAYGHANSDLGNYIEFANKGHPSYKT